MCDTASNKNPPNAGQVGDITPAAAPKRLWFVGQLPPTMSGQTVFNERMAKCLSHLAPVTYLPLGESSFQKIWRAVVNPLSLLFGLRRGDVVYTSVPGQSGLWLFLLTALALRLRGQPFYVHHHSYRPVAIGPLLAPKWLGRIAGGRANHILLCEKMCDDYAALYAFNDQEQFQCLPNAALFSQSAQDMPAQRTGPVVVGHMSVITKEKGVPYLLELWERLMAGKAPEKLVLAGPIVDEALKASVEAMVARYPGQVAWRGPVSGDAKRQFFEDIDLFVLPTQLIDEADPLVLHEAYSAGAAFMAPNRGCIQGRLLSKDWLMTMDLEDDAQLLKDKIVEVKRQRGTLPAKLMAHAQSLREGAHQAAVRFFAQFGADEAATQALLDDVRR